MGDRLLFLCTKPDNNQHCVVKFLRNFNQAAPQRTLPDTESRSVAGHRAHSLVPLTPPFMDQKVTLRVLSLTGTLSVDTLFRDRANRPLDVASLSP